MDEHKHNDKKELDKYLLLFPWYGPVVEYASTVVACIARMFIKVLVT